MNQDYCVHFDSLKARNNQIQSSLNLVFRETYFDYMGFCMASDEVPVILYGSIQKILYGQILYGSSLQMKCQSKQQCRALVGELALFQVKWSFLLCWNMNRIAIYFAILFPLVSILMISVLRFLFTWKILQLTKQSWFSTQAAERTLRWFGHLLRMPPHLPAKTIYDFDRIKFGWKRPRSQPKKSWSDSLSEFLTMTNIRQGEEQILAMDRSGWRSRRHSLRRAVPGRRLKSSKSSLFHVNKNYKNMKKYKSKGVTHFLMQNS